MRIAALRFGLTPACRMMRADAALATSLLACEPEGEVAIGHFRHRHDDEDHDRLAVMAVAHAVRLLGRVAHGVAFLEDNLVLADLDDDPAGYRGHMLPRPVAMGVGAQRAIGLEPHLVPFEGQ